MSEYGVPSFGNPIGPRLRWFAWHPVKTTDDRWRWLSYVWRQRFQTHVWLDGPTLRWWEIQT